MLAIPTEHPLAHSLLSLSTSSHVPGPIWSPYAPPMASAPKQPCSPGVFLVVCLGSGKFSLSPISRRQGN